jgi:hypothetical protein
MMNNIAILPQADASSIFEGIEIVGRYEPNAHKSNKGIDNITTTQSSTKSF